MRAVGGVEDFRVIGRASDKAVCPRSSPDLGSAATVPRGSARILSPASAIPSRVC
jgi:hypothetical protein